METHTDTEEAKAWVSTFVHWYNHTHQHSGIQFVTPYARHAGYDNEIYPNSPVQRVRVAYSLFILPGQSGGRLTKDFALFASREHALF